MKVGKSTHSNGGTVELAFYHHGGSALIVVDDESLPEYTASVNMIETIPEPLPYDEVWLKTWSENEGVPEALVAAGVVELTGDFAQAGHSTVVKARLTDEAKTALDFDKRVADHKREIGEA